LTVNVMHCILEKLEDNWISVSEHRRIWLKLDRKRDEGDEAATSSLLASHSVEHNHQLNWEEVTILDRVQHQGKKNHETAVMHIE
jgi:hypothetical protein